MATHDYKTGLQEIGDGVFAYIREGHRLGHLQLRPHQSATRNAL